MNRHADRIAQASAVALGFSIPLTIALNNVFLAITLAAWLVAPAWRDKLRAFTHPAAVVALAVFALIIVGALHADGTIEHSLLHLRKYLDLALIPVYLYLFREHNVRQKAVLALASSLAAVLVMSYLLKAGLMPAIPSLQGDSANPVVFKHHLTHNILMAFGVFLFCWLALDASSTRWRLAWSALAVLALLNTTIMVHGATGYAVLAGLMVMLALRRGHWLGIGMAAFSAALVAGALVVGGNPLQQRVDRVAREIQEWRVDEPAQSSAGLRLEFYRTTLSMIAERPLIGVGTGGFAEAYADQVKGTGKVATRNPHNEFLLMWVQLGILGLLALTWMFWRQWQLAARLPTRLESELARGLIATMVIGCMLNSLLLDHTEGLFYAWLTGVLYGGLEYGDAKHAAHREARAVSQNSTR